MKLARPEQALELIAKDPEAYLEALERAGSQLASWLVASLPQLHADGALAGRARAVLVEPEQTALFDLWLERRLVDASAWLDLSSFCALATRLAQERDPSFPPLQRDALTVTFQIPQCTIEKLDARVEGVGWTAEIESAYAGPAETIDDFTWRATAHGEGWRLTLGHDRPANGIASVWRQDST